MRKIVVIDYGLGNLLSVQRAVEACGESPIISSSVGDIESASHVILPGVGAFLSGMEGLRHKSLVGPIQTYARQGRPFLGICLGMQMMMDVSEEFGIHEGLGLIPGRVTPVPHVRQDGKSRRIPHIGWNRLQPAREQGWQNSILAGLPEKSYVYFVHSFEARPWDLDHRLAHCDYEGYAVSAAIRRGVLHGCQFHPEKSGPIGLKILKNFIQLESS